MGRARQQLHSAAFAERRDGHRDPFAAVLGGGRGLEPEVSLARDLAALNLDELLEEEDIDVIAGTYFRFRSGGGREAERLHEWLTEALAYDVWSGWWNDGMSKSLRMLGLGSRNRSPWLLSQEHGRRHQGKIRTVHIADLRPDLLWVGDDASREQLEHLRSLCGLDASGLDTQLNTRRSNVKLPRGSWRAPSKIGARRCPRCEALAVGLAIPALTEEAKNVRSGEFTALQLPALANRSAELLKSEPSYAAVRSLVSEEARAVILVRLTKLVSEDPVPTVMAALSVPERRSLTRFSQPDLHTRLAALDWEAILDEAIPRELSGAYNPAALASALNAACALLSF